MSFVRGVSSRSRYTRLAASRRGKFRLGYYEDGHALGSIRSWDAIFYARGFSFAVWFGCGGVGDAYKITALCRSSGVKYEVDPSQPLPFDLGKSHKLYQALFSQVEDMLEGKRLFIVPSGPLTSLPFHVLVTKKPETALPSSFEGYRNVAWLGKNHAISVLPAVSSLKALREHALRGERAPLDYIGYGDPVLTGVKGCRAAKMPPTCPEFQKPERYMTAASEKAGLATIGSGGTRGEGANVVEIFSQGATAEAVREKVRALCPLPDTAYEIRCVSERFKEGRKVIRLGKSATRADIMTLNSDGGLTRYRIVHFATHGLLSGDVTEMAKRQGEPALVLTPPDNPKNAEDTGLLLASEVAQLKLNADWVVLSACNTAAGQQLGAAALSGLARPFFYAGAKSLLVSHWPVYSEAAVKLTTRAFAELDWNPKAGRAEALQSAMNELMEDPEPRNAHPAVWAPFSIVGEGAR